MSAFGSAAQEKIHRIQVRRLGSFAARLKGLLGSSAPKAGEAVWLVPCNSIHTFGMKYPIDAYFLDKTGRVVAVENGLRPNRFSKIYWNAHSVLEFAAGEGRAFGAGDALILEESK